MARLSTHHFGCQTYSWEMSLERFQGRLSHMTTVAAAAGFTGFEPETVMLGENWTAAALKSALDAAGLQLAALALVCDWRESSETTAERDLADRVIEAVAAFPGAIINLVQRPGENRDDLAPRETNALKCIAAVAERAAMARVECAFHANSPAGSVFRTAADYDRLLAELDPMVGFTPDVGHIAAGGMDPVHIIRRMGHRVQHVHIKDIAADGSWAATGTGVLDIPRIIETLDELAYDRWIVFEDESPTAAVNPDRAFRDTGTYMERVLSSGTRTRL